LSLLRSEKMEIRRIEDENRVEWVYYVCKRLALSPAIGETNPHF